MGSRSTLLLLLVVVVAVAAIAYLLLGDGLGGFSGTGRSGEGDDADWGGLGDLEDPRLAPAPGAMTAEEREALRAPPIEPGGAGLCRETNG